MSPNITNKQLAQQTRQLIAIKKAVARHFEIPEKTLYSETRKYEIAGPRMIAMYLCRVLTVASFPHIADAFDKKHSTIMHAFNTTANRMTNNAAFADKVFAAKKLAQSELRAIKQADAGCAAS